MNRLALVLLIALPNALLLGQSLRRDQTFPPAPARVERSDRFSKSFPPEMAANSKARLTLTPARSCVSPNPTKHSLTIAPCAATTYRSSLVPAFIKTVPRSKPAPHPVRIR